MDTIFLALNILLIRHVNCVIKVWETWDNDLECILNIGGKRDNEKLLIKIFPLMAFVTNYYCRLQNGTIYRINREILDHPQLNHSECTWKDNVILEIDCEWKNFELKWN